MNILRTLTPGLFITLQVKAFRRQFSVSKNISHALQCWIKVNPVTIQEKKEVMISKVGCFTQGEQIMGSQNLGNIFSPSAPANT